MAERVIPGVPADNGSRPYYMGQADAMRQFMEAAPWWLRNFYESMPAWQAINWRYSSEDDHGPIQDGRQPAGDLPGAEAISSDFERQGHQRDLRSTVDGPDDNDFHGICIDIDHNAALVPSSTPGHSHLIIEHTVPWRSLKKLLEALAECGIIEQGYANASIERGATFVRLPWIRKGLEREDARSALDTWLEDQPEATPERPHVLSDRQALEAFLEEAS